MFWKLKGGGIARALRHREYRNFAIGDLVSLVGNWVQRVAVGWLTWELTESGVWLGLVSVAELAPSILFAPLGGAYADRADRRRIAVVTQAIMMAQAGSLAALTYTGTITIWSLLALTAARGCLNAWSHPARQALVPSLVPHDDMPAAIAINSVMFNMARFIGPMVSGLLIVQGSTGHAFLFNAISYFYFSLVLWRLRVPYPEAVTRRRQTIGSQLGEAYRYIVAHRGIGPILLLLLVTALLVRPIGDLLPGFAGAVFGTGAAGLAWMTSSMGFGAMIGGFLVAQRGQVAGLTRLAIGNTLVMGAALFGFAVAPKFWLALLALAITSFATSTMSISCQSLIQSAVDPNLRGRVISVYSVIFRTGPALGALTMGSLAELFGWHWPVAGGAVLCMLAWAWGRSRRRVLTQALESGPSSHHAKRA